MARRPLAEAGYADGLEITLDAPAGRYQGDKEIAEALGGQWQKAGFKPKVQVAESEGRGLYHKNGRIDELFDLGRSTTDPATLK